MLLLKKLLNEKFLCLLIDPLIGLLAKQVEEQYGLSNILTTFLLKTTKLVFEEIPWHSICHKTRSLIPQFTIFTNLNITQLPVYLNLEFSIFNFQLRMHTAIHHYLKEVNTRYKTGISREHSYRGDLQQLISALAPKVLVTNEPSRIQCGAPISVKYVNRRIWPISGKYVNRFIWRRFYNLCLFMEQVSQLARHNTIKIPRVASKILAQFKEPYLAQAFACAYHDVSIRLLSALAETRVGSEALTTQFTQAVIELSRPHQ